MDSDVSALMLVKIGTAWGTNKVGKYAITV
jgi:hypothetical protein